MEIGYLVGDGFVEQRIPNGLYPHTDDGMDVRPIFHKLRSLANENFKAFLKAA